MFVQGITVNLGRCISHVQGIVYIILSGVQYGHPQVSCGDRFVYDEVYDGVQKETLHFAVRSMLSPFTKFGVVVNLDLLLSRVLFVIGNSRVRYDDMLGYSSDGVFMSYFTI